MLFVCRKTSPHAFKLEAFIDKSNSSSIFERLGTLEYKEGSDVQLLPKTQVLNKTSITVNQYKVNSHVSALPTLMFKVLYNLLDYRYLFINVFNLHV